MKEKTRCAWAPAADPIYAKYHDTEWGKPSRDDRHLFEMFVLEAAQAGLSWITVLRKRENYRAAFDAFDPEKIARYSEKRLEKLLQNPGIIRNRLKVASAVTNAKAFLKVAEEHGAFAPYIWQFVGGKPIVNEWPTIKQVPARTKESDAMSKDLAARGFKFVGSTICYAYMQSVGMVNDHTLDCFRRAELLGKKRGQGEF